MPNPASQRRSCRPLRVLDVTDFYSDTVSGGVKTYLNAKASALASFGVEHAAIVPVATDAVDMLGRSRLYRVRGYVVPTSRAYRVMLSVHAVRDLIRRECPDVVEIGSLFLVPHMVSRALGRSRVPTVGFYHADLVRTFAEPYVPGRSAARRSGSSRAARRVR